MVDLAFASPTARKKFDCQACKDPIRRSRRCETDDFSVLKGMKVDDASASYTFCPGKASWYPWVIDLVQECRVAVETGILPKGGSLEDQEETFTEVFPHFLARWKERSYERVWEDVRVFTKAVLEAVLGKGK